MMFFIPPAILAIEDEDDRSFMENLYRSYYRLMYHEIFTVTSDPWLAEDILQNVVISLIRNLSTIKKLSTARLVNYIKTASINTSYNYLRKNRKLAVSTFTDLNYIAEILDSEEKGPELLYLQKEDAQKFMVVFHELDAKDQYLLTSRFVEGKSYSSMASDLGIQPNSVRMAVTRAKRRTFELLKQRYPDEK
ncbi:sigma-70 family RNA polymerase sigma factor [Clostridium sp.]|jgi:RNA polymerase sigma factor, sigma-70 family|uniref:sigma-70 family RNA polymerase sigma factor n=1 Tax=Clostridium sp. TaxID=1506 RepID=UPI001300A60A